MDSQTFYQSLIYQVMRTGAFGFTPVRQSVAYRRYEDSRLIVPCYSFWRANECSIAFLPACLWRAAVFVLMLQLLGTVYMSGVLSNSEHYASSLDTGQVHGVAKSYDR